MYSVRAREAPARKGKLRWFPDSRLGTALGYTEEASAAALTPSYGVFQRAVVRNRLCCNLRKIVVADEILDGTNMIDQLFGE